MPIKEEHEAALQRLLASGELTAAQADAVRREFSVAPGKRIGWLTEVAAYAGGGLMIAGAVLFLSSAWADLSQPAKVIILFGIAAILAVAAFFVTIDQGIRRATGVKGRAASGLLALAAIPVAFGAGVAAEVGKYQEVSNRNEGAWACTAGLLAGIVGLAIRSNALGIVITAIMTGGAAITVTDAFSHRYNGLTVGLLMFAAGILWIIVGLAKVVKPQQLALVAGGTLAIIGGQLPLDQDATKIWAYVLTGGFAIGCFLLYRLNRSMVMLVGGVIGLTLAVPEAIYDATGGGMSPAVILLIAGIVLVLASVFGIQLRKSIQDDDNPQTSQPGN